MQEETIFLCVDVKKILQLPQVSYYSNNKCVPQLRKGYVNYYFPTMKLTGCNGFHIGLFKYCILYPDSALC